MRRQLYAWKSDITSLNLGWSPIFLDCYKVFCLWIQVSPCVVIECCGKQIHTKQEVGRCHEKSSISGFQRPWLHGVRKRRSKFWNSLKVNHCTFRCFLIPRKVHDKKLGTIPSLSSSSTWPSLHPCNFSIHGLPNPELHLLKDEAIGQGWSEMSGKLIIR